MSGGVKRGVARDRDYGLGAAAGAGPRILSIYFSVLLRPAPVESRRQPHSRRASGSLQKPRKLHKC
jgi:hypothetical protein